MIEGDWKERVEVEKACARAGGEGWDREIWCRGLKVARGKGGWMENGDGEGTELSRLSGKPGALRARRPTTGGDFLRWSRAKLTQSPEVQVCWKQHRRVGNARRCGNARGGYTPGIKAPIYSNYHPSPLIGNIHTGLEKPSECMDLKKLLFMRNMSESFQFAPRRIPTWKPLIPIPPGT